MKRVTAPAGRVEEVRRLFAAATAVTARAVFHAKAASVLLLDEGAGDLVFAAVAGEGAELLLGSRISTTTGIAGSVVASGKAEVIANVAADERFAHHIAEAIGYVPAEMMAAPLVSQGRPLGVIEVLDRPQFSHFSTVELDLLRLIAEQAAIAFAALTEAELRS